MVSRRQLLTMSSGVALGVLAGCAAEQTPATAPAGSASADPSSATPSPTSAPTATQTTGTRTAEPSPSSTPRATPRESGPPRPRLDGTVADDLDVPWGLVFLRSGEALVGERNSGRLLRIEKSGKKTAVGEVSDVAAPTPGQGEGGLLGLALAPGDDDTLFAYLTSQQDNRVVRVDLRGGKVRKQHPVLTGIPRSVHHNGGALRFDRDGMLFVSTGDAQNSANAQDRDSLAGKILRIRPNGRAAAGNPYGNRTWSYGHRNVEGLAFDADGRLWATEFGEKAADELNVIRRGRNYGWPEAEGRSSNDDFTNPRATWRPTSSCSPAGLAITRSTAFVGALQGQCLFGVPLDGVDAGEPKAYFAGDHGRIRGVFTAPDGSLWITTSNTDGRADPGRDDDRILRVTL